jgi:hypothetical protein
VRKRASRAQALQNNCMEPKTLQNPFAAESEISIDTEGVWFYRGTEITRRETIRLFYKNLIQDPSGRYFIEIGPQRYPVAVGDTAFVVRSIARVGTDSHERIQLFLSDDTEEELNPGTLRIGAGNIPYCSIRNGGFVARFSKAAYYRLAEHIIYDSIHDKFCLPLNGQSFYLHTSREFNPPLKS